MLTILLVLQRFHILIATKKNGMQQQMHLI